MLRKAVEALSRPLVMIGFWVMFLPGLLLGAGMAIYLIVNFRGLGNFVFFWASVGLIFISAVILFRLTRNYVSRRRDE